MTVTLEPDVIDTLLDIAEFIDSIHTQGTGQLWVTDFISHIYTFAIPNVTYALCSNKILAENRLSCISYKGWVIAFKIELDQMIVSLIIRGNMIY
jgi:hypothetical protein